MAALKLPAFIVQPKKRYHDIEFATVMGIADIASRLLRNAESGDELTRQPGLYKATTGITEGGRAISLHCPDRPKGFLMRATPFFLAFLLAYSGVSYAALG